MSLRCQQFFNHDQWHGMHKLMDCNASSAMEGSYVALSGAIRIPIKMSVHNDSPINPAENIW